MALGSFPRRQFPKTAAFLICLPCLAQQYDLLLKNGHVIDPRNNLDAVADVAIRQGKVAAVAPNLNPASAGKTIDRHGPLRHTGHRGHPYAPVPHYRPARRLGGRRQHRTRQLQLSWRRHHHGGRRQLRMAHLRDLPPYRDRSRADARAGAHQHRGAGNDDRRRRAGEERFQTGGSGATGAQARGRRGGREVRALSEAGLGVGGSTRSQPASWRAFR